MINVIKYLNHSQAFMAISKLVVSCIFFIYGYANTCEYVESLCTLTLLFCQFLNFSIETAFHISIYCYNLQVI